MNGPEQVGTSAGSRRGAEWFSPKLRRVLLAYAQHNPTIGYCQERRCVRLHYVCNHFISFTISFHFAVDGDARCVWQSLNYLGGVIVCVVDGEEDSFWLLAAMLE